MKIKNKENCKNIFKTYNVFFKFKRYVLKFEKFTLIATLTDNEMSVHVLFF